MTTMRVASSIKSLVVPAGRSLRQVTLGLNRGLLMHLDLMHDSQRKLGLYEREVAGFVRSQARRIRTGIDVGAGDGYYTLYLMSKSSAQRVYAFEPSGAARSRIAENLKANGLDSDERFVLSAQAVGCSTGVGLATLDEIAGNLSTPCLVKIDVEGAEMDVLTGAARLLERTDVAWLVETHSRQLEDACVLKLTATGYTTKVVDKAWWRVLLPEQRPLSHNRWLIAVRRSQG